MLCSYEEKKIAELKFTEMAKGRQPGYRFEMMPWIVCPESGKK